LILKKNMDQLKFHKCAF